MRKHNAIAVFIIGIVYMDNIANILCCSLRWHIAC